MSAAVDLPLLGKVAIVTGASQGIGAATATQLAAQGARVALLARSVTELQAVVTAIAANQGIALAVPTDIRADAQVTAAFAMVAVTFGPIDLLVNCAGAIANRPFIEMDMATWDMVQATNVRGTMVCCREAFQQMVPHGGGTIINISSLAGVKNVEKFPGLSAYITSKFAVAGLTEALAVEGRPYGIRVLAISPGAVDTPMLRAAAPHLNPGMTPDDMARIIVFCASPAGRFLSGTNLELFSNE